MNKNYIFSHKKVSASSKLSVCELIWLGRDAFVDLLEWVEGIFLEFSVALVGTLIIGL